MFKNIKNTRNSIEIINHALWFASTSKYLAPIDLEIETMDITNEINETKSNNPDI